MKVYYLPAFIHEPSLLQSFFEQGSPFFRPQGLISYAAWSGRSVGELISRCPGKYIFGDSGGFSIVSRNAKVDPEKVIRWQMDNCDVGVILDVPPYRISGRSYKTAGDIWDDSLKRTLSNVRRALPYYSELFYHPEWNFSWWGVVQGETATQMESWYEAVAHIYPFEENGEGWAIKPTPDNDFFSMARAIKLVDKYDIKRLHMLMTTGMRTTAALFSMLRLAGVDLEVLSFDSTSAAIYAVNRHAWTPSEDGTMLVEWLPRASSPKAFAAMPCDCPACRLAKSVYEDTGTIEHAQFRDLRCLHNDWVLSAFFDRAASEAERDPDQTLRIYAGGQYGDAMRALDGSAARQRSTSRPISILDRL